jgi:hypothetical protein
VNAAMGRASIESSPQFYARIGGLFYLAIILLGLFGEPFVRGTLVVAGDATATAHHIANAQFLWRAGIAGDLLMHVCDLPVILILYVLLKPVNKDLALLATLFNLIQTAVLVLNKLTLLMPLFLMEGGSGLNGLAPDQLHALAYVAIQAHGHGFGIGLIFFGFACLVRGVLIFKSGYFPKALGVLMLLAGLSYLLNSFALLLAPALAAALFPAVLVPALVGELSLCLWMIFRGIRMPAWQQRVQPT